jgi:hypothetical protein
MTSRSCIEAAPEEEVARQMIIQRTRRLWGVVVLATACRSQSETSEAAPAPSTDASKADATKADGKTDPVKADAKAIAAVAPPPVVATPRTDYLVVAPAVPPEKDGLSRYRTVWIEGTAGGFEERAAHDGIAASDGTQVWFLTDKAHTFEVVDCECDTEAPDARKACVSPSKVGEAILVDDKGTERPSATPPVARDVAPTPFDQLPAAELNAISLVSVVGPWLTYGEFSQHVECGMAHGVDATTYTTIDLRSGNKGLPWTPGKQKTYTDPHVSAAKTKLCAAAKPAVAAAPDDEGGEDPVDGCDATPFKSEVTAVIPGFVDGALQVLAQFTTATAYADSDGTAGGYARSVRLPITIPSFFTDLAKVPPTVDAYWKAHPPKPAPDHEGKPMIPAEGHGWSAITGTPAELAAKREAFAKAAPSNFDIGGD